MSIGMPQMETHFQHAGRLKNIITTNHITHNHQPPTTSTSKTYEHSKQEKQTSARKTNICKNLLSEENGTTEQHSI